jgi:hypothetical protein
MADLQNMFTELVHSSLMIVIGIFLNYKINGQRKRIDVSKDRINATQEGVQALLRDALVNAYDRAMEYGSCSISKRESVEKMFTQYHKLGGNGTIGDLIEKMNALPTDPPKKRQYVRKDSSK